MAPPERQIDLERDTELLDAELPDPRFVDHHYLEWLYDRNPFGPGITASVDDEGQRVAHYGLVPQVYRDRRGPAPFVFSLNAVTRSGIQRKGYFTRLGHELYARATERGIRVVVGVTNENSTPPVLNKLGFRLYCPLPVRVCVPVRRRPSGWESRVIDEELLSSSWFESIAADLDDHPADGWTNCYGLPQLRWRLGMPNNPGFVLHVGPDLVAVSTRSHAGPIPMAVVLKLLPRHGRGTVLSGAPAIAASCRHHRTPAAVYAGWNRWVGVRGVRPPRRFLPAPLNLIVKSLDPDEPQESLVLDTFEFLDMDAY